MFRGFDVKIKEYSDYHYKIGLNLFNSNRTIIKKTIDNFIGVDGVIDGSDLQENWFKNIDSHIFISHSHKDEKLAIALAGFLYEKFKLICFIDSCIWGYSNNLLRQLDNKYCRNIDGKNYNYDLRNSSTSHVHMMLSTALTMMIDKSEAIFFINTPNSLISAEITAHTYSPWIYSEILTSKFIRKQVPLRALNENRTFSTKAVEDTLTLRVKYNLDMRQYVELNESEILEWSTKNFTSPEDALDKLYEQKPPRSRYII